jgi:hypothetical protein
MSELDWQAYRDVAQGILDDLPQLPEKAEEFALAAEDKLTSMIAWMEDRQHVTEPMAEYIDNKRAAVNSWLEKMGLA